MKKIGFLIVFVVIVSGTLRSQISREILAYVDSTEMLVLQGRRMMVNELNNNNLEKVKEIYDYLTDATRSTPFAAFYFVEDLYINLLTGNWPMVESYMSNYHPKENRRIYPNSPEIFPVLIKMVQERSPMILAGSKDAGLNEEAWRLLDLIFYYNSKDRKDEVYNKKLSDYRKTYRTSAYPEFGRHFIPEKLSKAALNFSLGSGMVSPSGDLSKYFSGNAVFNMGMDVNVDRVFTSLYLQGTNLKTKLPFIAVTPRDTLFFNKGDKFSYLDAGLKGGYFVLRNNRFHLAPYASISGSVLESNLYDDPRDNKLEVKVFNSFTYGAGIHTEVKCYEYGMQNIYGVSNKGYLSLKLDAGYNKMSKMKNLANDGAMLYVNLAFVIGFGQF
ncbi:MAG TPA: hypothetical protein PKE03_04865 [Bacteroidales bacterium]|nr:hypothetical protein [Bacteroidales bacterium]